MKPIQLTIAEPCHENWNQMLPEQQGKFCLSCQKTVVDFSAMSDREVLHYFTTNTGSTCGRFNNEQLNKTISIPKERSIGRWKYFWQFLLPAVFAMHKVEAQKTMGKPAICKPQPVKQEPMIRMGIVAMPLKHDIIKPTIIEAKVLDEKGKPIPNASVRISNNAYGLASDSAGKFSVSLEKDQSLTISSIGYESRCISYGDFINMPGFKMGLKDGAVVVSGMEITLKSTVALLKDVVVTSYGTVGRLTYTAGGISVVRSSRYNIFKTKKVVPVQTIVKIYPNPITTGQNFKVAFTVPKKDIYLLEIIDASGKLIQAQTINMQSIQQTETIDGSRLQQAGVYIIHLTNGEKKNVFNGKLVVQ